MPYRVGDVTVRLTNIKPGPADTLRLRGRDRSSPSGR